MNRKYVPRLDRAYGLWLRSFVTECGICGITLDDTAQVSHCFRRAYLAVRWNVKNAWLVHNFCHRGWESLNPVEREEFMRIRIGNEAYDELKATVYSQKKWTDADAERMLKGFKV